MDEKWLKINDFEYYISNYGRIKNSKDKILKNVTDNTGYIVVTLVKDHKKYKRYIHRLVALYFVTNKNNYKEVNHIDGNKSNNHYLNLEWTTRSKNMRHSVDILGHKHGKRRKVQCLETGIIYDSLKDACKDVGGSTGNLCALLKDKNRSKTFAKFHWVYVDL